MITNVYVDGFNLYYRALKDTPFRWLDLRKLAATLLPEDTIQTVYYFTARLDARPGNPTQPQRQQAYLRALATLPDFEIHTERSGPASGAVRWPSRSRACPHTSESGTPRRRDRT